MRKFTVIGLVLATVVVACESKTPVGPSAVTIEQVTTTATSCTFSLSPASGTVPITGGSGTITVVTQTGCSWTVENFAAWVTVQPTTGGTGAGQIQYTAAATTAPRETTIVVAGLPFLLRQDTAAPGPTPPITATTVTRRFIGNSGNAALPNDMTLALQLVTSSGFFETLMESLPFHDPTPLRYSATGVYRTGNGGGGTVRGTLNGTLDDGIFNGTLTAEVPGCSAAREYSGQLSVSTLQWTGGRVIQDCKDNPLSFSNLTMVSGGSLPPTTTIPTTTAPGCTYGLNPGSGSIGLAGGSGSVEVVTQPGCGWSAQSVVPWVTVQPTSGAAGPGRVQYTVTEYTATSGSPQRESTLIIAGLPFVLRQASAPTPTTTTTAQACTYSLSPQSGTVPASGGSGSTTVVTQSGCAWSVQVFANWITVQPTSGTGSGQVQYTAGATDDVAREATIVVGGLPFLLRQDAPPPPARADLVPISRTDPSYCRYADDYDVNGLVIGVGNQGSGAAGPSRARITYTHNGTTQIFEEDTDPLGVGASTNVVFPLPGSCSNYSCTFTFSVQVDAAGQIPESVESNNVAFGSCQGGYSYGQVEGVRRPRGGGW